MRLHYFYFLRLSVSTFSLFSLRNNKNNNNNNNNNNNTSGHNNSNNNNIIPYTSVGFYSSLCTFTLNVIINTHLFKENTNLATRAVP